VKVDNKVTVSKNVDMKRPLKKNFAVTNGHCCCIWCSCCIWSLLSITAM